MTRLSHERMCALGNRCVRARTLARLSTRLLSHHTIHTHERHTCCDDDVSFTLLVLELELMTFWRDVLSFCFCRFSSIDAISGLGLGTAGSDNSGICRKKENKKFEIKCICIQFTVVDVKQWDKEFYFCRVFCCLLSFDKKATKMSRVTHHWNRSSTDSGYDVRCTANATRIRSQ